MILREIRNSIKYNIDGEQIKESTFFFADPYCYRKDEDEILKIEKIQTDEKYLIFSDESLEKERIISISGEEIKIPKKLCKIKRFYNYEGNPSFIADNSESQTKVFAEIRQGRLTPIFTFRECILHDESEIIRSLLSEFGGQSLVEFVKEDDEGVYSELFLLKNDEIFVVESLFDVKYSYFDYVNGTNNIDDSAFDRCLSYGNPPRILRIRDKEQALLADMQAAESLDEDRFIAILSPHTINLKQATYHHYVTYPATNKYRIGWTKI